MSNLPGPKSRKERTGLDASEAESSRSPSLMEAMMANIQLEENLSSKATLKKFLSIRSVVSTTSSFADDQQSTVWNQGPYRRIGAGTCAYVVDIPGANQILKVAKHPGQSTDQLWEDYLAHNRVSFVFDKIGRSNIAVHVPKLFWFVSASDEAWWESNLPRFPKDDQNASNLLCAERILPLPRPIRHALIDEFCPQRIREKTKADPSSADCLVRLYLGKRRPRPSNFFQLRNFPMFLDQMESLGLDVISYAEQIAEALAVMHWAVGLDANDVEFVLGSSPAGTAFSVGTCNILPATHTPHQLKNTPRNTSTWSSHVNDFHKRIVHVWMFDFNRCRDFSKDDSGIDQLVHSFYINDPYYPRPLVSSQEDQELWKAFKNKYLLTSKKVNGNTDHPLALRFIYAVVAEQKKKMEAKSKVDD
ncbi:zinc finger protein-domain-containing protein [Dendryphion nanum]|uniref:Zinc finger protein-domain-containing protein n=1 Tax=Dendryphion nanum TaxID=256645 RepID=A0A9P9DCX1_9PLEO|nr:zinc finger protein-domain-containing protein [Dendryphion nanum]